MKTNCAFTIVAKNYIGLALILEKSIRKYYNNLDFYIIVADEFESKQHNELPPNVLIAKEILDIDEKLWNNMSFKYDLTEFCTSIKPYTINYFFNETYDKVIYLDPDICFFSSIEPIFNALENYDLILTPHIIFPPKLGDTDSPESDWLNCGIYNLGFIALKNSENTREMIIWWSKRLENNCFNDRTLSEYTDQKWMNFIPAIFEREKLLISRNLGWNMAPWNFFERKIEINEDNELWVKPRICDNGHLIHRLIFVHYSGYNYNELLNGKIEQNNIRSIRNYPDTTCLFKMYSEELKGKIDIFKNFIDQKYSYNHFSNNKPILPFHRKLYAGLHKKGVNLHNPFDSDDLFYKMLSKRKMIYSENIGKKNKFNIPNISKKLMCLNLISKFVFKILGAEKYFMLISFLYPYSNYSVHIHLLDDSYKTNNIF